jgi:uncharacterized UPF0160 family protein
MRVIVHNGKVHTDECAAVSLLSNYYANKGIGVSVLRTRDYSKFLLTDLLLDVGSEYDHEKLRYDHHQPNFNEKWKENSPTNLSAAGLIWRHYGKEIIEMYLSNNVEQYDYAFNYTDTTITELMDMIYEKLIMEIDANDNGVVLPGSHLNICEIVDAVNCSDVNNDELQNANFNRAVSLIGNIFDIKFREIINGYFNYYRDLDIVRELLIRNIGNDYLIVDQNIPTIFKCLDEIDRQEQIRFCIFSGKNEYSIKTRRKNKKFLPLCPILSEEMLRIKMENSNDIIFIHKASFLAKTRSLQAAKEIVALSIQSFEEVERNSKDEKDEKKDEKKDDKEDAKDEKELQEIKKVEQLL